MMNDTTNATNETRGHAARNAKEPIMFRRSPYNSWWTERKVQAGGGLDTYRGPKMTQTQRDEMAAEILKNVLTLHDARRI